MPTRNLRDGSVVVTDGQAQTITLALEDDSGLQWSETHNVVNVSDRGVLSHMRPGDEAPVTGQIGLKFVDFAGVSTAPTLYEALTHTGNATSWTSTNLTGSDVYTVQMVFTVAAVGSQAAQKITFAKVCPMGEIAFAEGDEFDTMTFPFQDFETAPAIA